MIDLVLQDRKILIYGLVAGSDRQLQQRLCEQSLAANAVVRMDAYALTVDREHIEDDAIIERNMLADMCSIDGAAEPVIGDLEWSDDAPVQRFADAEHV